ncbi:hypothetical protein BC833DRAFT_426896 [Globomyces pollinis-pini]|nr:hypothetical protein BC833DRAFT_426896 [Globomyces pollinis-pini]
MDIKTVKENEQLNFSESSDGPSLWDTMTSWVSPKKKTPLQKPRSMSFSVESKPKTIMRSSSTLNLKPDSINHTDSAPFSDKFNIDSNQLESNPLMELAIQAEVANSLHEPVIMKNKLSRNSIHERADDMTFRIQDQLKETIPDEDITSHHKSSNNTLQSPSPFETTSPIEKRLNTPNNESYESTYFQKTPTKPVLLHTLSESTITYSPDVDISNESFIQDVSFYDDGFDDEISDFNQTEFHSDAVTDPALNTHASMLNDINMDNKSQGLFDRTEQLLERAERERSTSVKRIDESPLLSKSNNVLLQTPKPNQFSRNLASPSTPPSVEMKSSATQTPTKPHNDIEKSPSVATSMNTERKEFNSIRSNVTPVKETIHTDEHYSRSEVTEVEDGLEAETISDNYHSISNETFPSSPYKMNPQYVPMSSYGNGIQSVAPSPLKSNVTPKVHKVVEGLKRNQNQHVEFDPLIPQDWMMSFESPTTSKLPEHGHHAPTPPVSLLDTFEPMASPKSAIRYSQHDVDKQLQALRADLENQLGLAQQEILELSMKNRTLESDKKKMMRTLSEWELAIQKMMNDRELEVKNANKSYETLNAKYLDQVRQTDNVKGELDSQTLNFKQLRVDFADLREVNSSLRDTCTKLEEDLQKSTVRFDTLREHAESKLEEANVEIAKVQTQYEKELVASRAKISRLECHNNTLERQLEGKIQENLELIRICDGLERQLI